MAEEKKTKKAATKKTTASKGSDASSSSPENQSQGPGFGIEKLFLKDVSVEVTNSPEIFTNREAPQINIELNNNAKPLADGFYEVALQITVTSKQADKTAFLIDVTQAGIFAVKNVPEENIEHEAIKTEKAPLPEVSEHDLVMHFSRLAHRNFAVDLGFYPLGSCTMKYNPRFADWVASLPCLLYTSPSPRDS